MEPCRVIDPRELVLCGGMTNCGAACGVTTGGTDVADICRLSCRVSRLSGIWTESALIAMPVLGGIAGGGPLVGPPGEEVEEIPTDPCDWTRCGNTGAFIFGGSGLLLLTDAGLAGMFGFVVVTVTVVGWTVCTLVTIGGGCCSGGAAMIGLPTTVCSLLVGCGGKWTFWTVLGDACGGTGSVWCFGDGWGEAGGFSCSCFGADVFGPNGKIFLFSCPAAKYENKQSTE